MTRLGELIAERIREGGPISFAEFMEISLYHPELGYYARDAPKTGRAGDFFTSVDVGPMFGELLAKQLAEMFEISRRSAVGSRQWAVDSRRSAVGSRFDVVEVGAGSGRLARDILDAAAQHHPEFYEAVCLSLVERSPAARRAQRDTLAPHASKLTYSDETLPEHVSGVIVANELLDALPTHALVMTGEGLREVFVGFDAGRFVEMLLEPSSLKLVEYLARADARLEPGWRAEVNLNAERWIKRAADVLDRGFLVIIDYGHEQHELYGASHAGGTLMTFAQHTTERDWQEPGTFDITAHVDLSAIQRAAGASGLQTLAVMDQTYFMLGLGMEEMMGLPEGFDAASLQRRLALKTLLLPGGLGSTHKVLIFGKDVGAPKLKCASYRERLT